MAINKKWVQVTEDDILEANISKYNDDNIVNFYKDFEEPKYAYIEYEVIFKAVMEALSKSIGRRLKAIDMCGGAGKAAFVMKQINPASEVTLVDLSEKMLDIARQRMVKEGGGEIKIVQADAFSFLENAEQYDLIVFSSAIHHFKDPIKLLIAAGERLSPQGIIITIADPSILTKTRRYKFFEFLLTHRDSKYKAVKTCVKKVFSPSDIAAADDEYVDIAEYQTYTGIDDKALAYQLGLVGLHPLTHLRYPAGEPYMVKIMPYIGLCWAFSLILRKGQHQDDIKMTMEIQDKIKAGLPFKFSIL